LARESLQSDAPPREDHTLTVDGIGQNAWLFGGRDGDRVRGDLWRLDLATDSWTRIEPSGPRPSARFGHSAAWVDGVGVVVFGGQTRTGFANDLWAWRPDTGDWRELPSRGAVPRPRYGSCAALGPDGRLWISHGFTADGRFDDTRAYDFTAERWRNRSATTGERPVARCLHECFWTTDGQLALYGGQTTGVAALGDLWSFDPAARAWQRQPDPAAPARRLYGAAQVDDGVWVFGGAGADGARLDDLWRLDRSSLELVAQAVQPGEAPDPRSAASLVFDPGRGRLLLYAGEVGSGDRTHRVSDLWALSALP
jgi:hypothetical protein